MIVTNNRIIKKVLRLYKGLNTFVNLYKKRRFCDFVNLMILF